MKAFEMKLDHEKEWVCANTKEEALEYYLSEWVAESEKEKVVCREVHDDELDNITITYYGEEDESGELPTETFREYLKTATCVEKFCSTWDY